MGRDKKYNTEEEKKEGAKLARKRYRDKNKVKVYEQQGKWRKENKDRVSQYQKNYIYNLSEEEILRKKEYMKEYLNTYKYRVKERRVNDSLFRLKCSTRSLIHGAITRKGYKKNTKTEEILGCSFDEFKSHIESQWESWMNWGNYGKYNGECNYGWDIDHIIPSSSALNEVEIIKLNNFSNLQPLCSKINRDVKKEKMSMDF